MANEVLNEDLVCKALNIPSIPKKEWDGKKSFKRGVAILDMADERRSYAVATFNSEKDITPRIVKVFTLEQFKGISKIFVIPDYMDDDVDNMDLDDASKRAAKSLLEEAKELENEGVDTNQELPENEYFFDHIHNDDEAMAFIKDYNKRNRIKGRVPTNHDKIVMRLSVIYSETNSKKSKKWHGTTYYKKSN